MYNGCRTVMYNGCRAVMYNLISVGKVPAVHCSVCVECDLAVGR
jgi:hypothetical protein